MHYDIGSAIFYGDEITFWRNITELDGQNAVTAIVQGGMQQDLGVKDRNMASSTCNSSFR